MRAINTAHSGHGSFGNSIVRDFTGVPAAAYEIFYSGQQRMEERHTLYFHWSPSHFYCRLQIILVTSPAEGLWVNDVCVLCESGGHKQKGRTAIRTFAWTGFKGEFRAIFRYSSSLNLHIIKC